MFSSSIGGTKCLTGSSLASHDKKTPGVPYFPSSYLLFKFEILTMVYHNPLFPPKKKKKKKTQGGGNPLFHGTRTWTQPGPPHLYESQSGVPKLISSKMEPRDHLKGFVREISGWKFTGGNLGIWKDDDEVFHALPIQPWKTMFRNRTYI